MEITTIQNDATSNKNNPLPIMKFADKLRPAAQFAHVTRLEISDGKFDSPSALTQLDRNAQTVKKFQNMIIGLMIKPMFHQYAEFTFGKGVQADVYSSLYSEAISKSLVDSGGLGIANLLAPSTENTAPGSKQNILDGMKLGE